MCRLQIQWYSPQASNSTNKLEYVCVCVRVSVCVCVFFLCITNCIAYCAIYDTLKKSKMKSNSRNQFFPRTKSKYLLASVS